MAFYVRKNAMKLCNMYVTFTGSPGNHSSPGYVISLTSFLQGLGDNATSPALPDLAQRLCITFEQVSWAMSAKSIGRFLGVVSFGFIIER